MNSVSASDEATEGAGLSRTLGWLAVAAGLTDLAVPTLMARAAGLKPNTRTSLGVRAMGAHSLASGLAILLRPRRPAPMWVRFAGDFLDLGVFGLLARSRTGSKPRIGATLLAMAARTTLDAIASHQVQQHHDAVNRPVISSVTINKPPGEVYAYFRQLEQLPLFMTYLAEVRQTGPRTSHWVAKLPVVGNVAWDAEITEEKPGEVIAWRSAEGSPITMQGRATFVRAPGRNMTELRVELKVGLMGKPSAALAKLLTRPEIKGDLRRLKQVMETGEVLRSDASVHRLPHPAQPPDTRIEPPRLPFTPHPPTAEKGVLP
jgi:uncharacterized membrane protein